MRQILASMSLLTLLAACSEGRKQYRAPDDQRVDQKAGPADSLIPKAPSNPKAGLIDGWFVDPTPKEAEQKILDAIRAPIIPGVGLAGVTIDMERSEIESKIGQPDFSGVTSFGAPVAFYGSDSIVIYYDSVSKNKVSQLIATGGYTGAVQGLGFEIGKDLASDLSSAGGPEGLMRKIYRTVNPSIPDCIEARLCETIRGTDLAYLSMTNSFAILLQDAASKPEKRIFEIRVQARTPDAGTWGSGQVNLDLLNGRLQQTGGGAPRGLELGRDSWATAREIGNLAALVEPRDFGRGSSFFSLGLSNDLYFVINRSAYRDTEARQPQDTDTVVALQAGASFQGTLSIGEQQLQLQLCSVASSRAQAADITINLKHLQQRDQNGQAVWAIDGQETPSSTRWRASVATLAPDAALSENCVGVPLQPDLGETFRAALQAAVASLSPQLVSAENADLSRGLEVEADGGLRFRSLFSFNPSRGWGFGAEAVDATLALAHSIFEETFQRAFDQSSTYALENSKKVLRSVDEGNRSIEDKATFMRRFVIYDDESLQRGRQVSIFFFEASEKLLIASELLSPDYASTNSNYSMLARSPEGSINLDQPLSIGELTVGSAFQTPGSLVVDPFDRSQRYAEILDANDRRLPATYTERRPIDLAIGGSVVTRVFDGSFVFGGIAVLGKRVEGRSDTTSTFEIQAMELRDFPVDTTLTITCRDKPISLAIGGAFTDVYTKLAGCDRYLTPGYSVQNRPSELHVGPEGERSHGLIFQFVDGILTGFLVFNPAGL